MISTPAPYACSGKPRRGNPHASMTARSGVHPASRGPQPPPPPPMRDPRCTAWAPPCLRKRCNRGRRPWRPRSRSIGSRLREYCFWKVSHGCRTPSHLGICMDDLPYRSGSNGASMLLCGCFYMVRDEGFCAFFGFVGRCLPCVALRRWGGKTTACSHLLLSIDGYYAHGR